MQHTDEPVANTNAVAGTGQTPDTTEQLEQRVHTLETQVDSLVLAVRALVEGLERTPGNETGDVGRSARSARLAHEILLSRGL
ncbi:hypothetical protein [Streptomyces sp. S.PB5]|uniref:hypothetical protein n=1 Tax=Streptomyces sp. S.PB5 TaxID=3020844 RepID=UPI0025B02185|nr:hypothetical protein [Streptomyces sp. S.PB5]MDN3028976.1 hypothetical protein [Streptomyces sp. S.PB5]